MASSLPYVPSNKNIETLFAKIASAKVPDKFTHSFLQQTIGLKGTNDRAYIPLLRTLGFLDASGTPSSAYRELKNAATAKSALARGVRAAYGPLFEANESAHTLTPDKLKGLVAQVAGTDEGMTARIVSTFNALAKIADFNGGTAEEEEQEGEPAPSGAPVDEQKPPIPAPGQRLRPEFHYNIQIHLPANGPEEVYLNIFNALRKVFQ
jgi:hypothetical protein